MRYLLPALALALWPLAARAGGFNVNYLVPAFVVCPGPGTCGAPVRESRFTYETAALKVPRGRYLNPKKPSLIVELKGVKDENGSPVTGDSFRIRIDTGQVNLPSLGTTIPAGHALSQQEPIAIPLRNGNTPKGGFPYSPEATAPAGTIVEGGGITILDSDGRRLAVTGTQAK